MAQLYSIKPPGSLLWKSGWKREDVLAQARLGKLEDNLLICPVGEAKEAISLKRFVDDPDIFRKRKAKLADWKRSQKQIADAVEKPWLRKAGAGLLAAWGVCFSIAGGTIAFGKTIFPMLGWDLGTIAIPMIVGVWSLCGVGLVVWLAGWFQHRRRIRDVLRQQPPFDPDGT